MAKTKASEVQEPTTTETALAPRGETSVATIDQELANALMQDVADNVHGEQLQQEFTIPRLSVAQKMSPQVDASSPMYVEGLKVGDFFNTLTGDIYGPGPIRFIPLRVEPPRWMELAPFEQGGGIIDFDVKAGDPRTEWRTINGERKPPVATMFYDYIVYLPDTDETVALSCKSTNISSAKKFNGIRLGRRIPPTAPAPLDKVAGKPAPLYMQMYTVDKKQRTEGNKSWFIFEFKVAGWSWNLSTTQFATVRAQHDALRTTTEPINIDRRDLSVPDEGTDFNYGANAPSESGVDANDPGM